MRVAPGAKLSKKGLIVAFAVMISVGLSVYALFPSNIGGPPLPVEVSLEKAPMETASGKIAVLTDVVKITSTLDQPIQNLTVILNGHYWMTQSRPLEAGETVAFPLEVFTDKRSSRRFDPAIQEVNAVVVGGQLPSKSRGISKFEFGEGASH